MMSLVSYIRFLKNDLVPRYAVRLRRPLKEIIRAKEFRSRVAVARAVDPETCYDLNDLTRSGFLAVQPPPGMLEAMCKAASAKMDEPREFQQKGTKVFFSQLLKKEDLTLEGPYLPFALDEKLLRTAARYLGSAPFLESIELLHSRPVDSQSRSQLWHRDRTDKAIFKIFVYCRDVGPENGPFSFLDAQDSKKIPDNLPHYLTDDEVNAYVPISRTKRITGEAGTSFLIDTCHCYHFGSRCAQPRLAYVAYYTSGFAFFARETRWKDIVGKASGLSRLQKLALGLPDA